MPTESNQNTTLVLYRIKVPEWHNVTERQRELIANMIVKGGWRIVGQRRRGFLNCERQGNVVFGYFAHEGALDVEQYDDQQQPRSEEQSSFERMLFLLFLDEGLILAQSMRVYHYRDLTGPKMRDALFSELEVALKDVGMSFPRISLERYREERTRQEMFEIFLQHEISRVEVDQLNNQRVPEEVKLFNPNFDADHFLKSQIEDTLGLSDQVEWKGQSLQKARIVKGIMAAGSPKVVEGIDTDGQPREWYRSAPEEIELPLNTSAVHFPAEDFERLLVHVGRKLGLLRDRLRQTTEDEHQGARNLPLFGDEI